MLELHPFDEYPKCGYKLLEKRGKFGLFTERLLC
jgi:hypothetical protein